MLEYRVQPSRTFYSLSYGALREDYYRYCDMSDEEFIKSLPDALHFACIVAWLKELGGDATLGDEGIIHQLVHLLDGTDGPAVNLSDIRQSFALLLKLA